MYLGWDYIKGVFQFGKSNWMHVGIWVFGIEIGLVLNWSFEVCFNGNVR